MRDQVDQKAELEVDEEVYQRLIQVSFAKIVNSKHERGGAKLHKNLLVLHLLKRARNEQRRSISPTDEMDDYTTIIVNRADEEETEEQLIEELVTVTMEPPPRPHSPSPPPLDEETSSGHSEVDINENKADLLDENSFSEPRQPLPSPQKHDSSGYCSEEEEDMHICRKRKRDSPHESARKKACQEDLISVFNSGLAGVTTSDPSNAKPHRSPSCPSLLACES